MRRPSETDAPAAATVPPARWHRRHWRQVWMIAVLVFTGMGLFLPTWRSGLGPLLPTVQAVHEWGGLAYGAGLLLAAGRFFPWPARPLTYTRWGYFFLVGLVITGLGLLVGPSWTHALATVGHAAFAVALVAWVVWHLATRVPLRRLPARPSSGRPARWMMNRRGFLRWSVAGAASLPVLAGVPPMLRLLLGSAAPAAGPLASQDGALPGFIPYTVVNGYPAIAETAWRLALTRRGQPVGQWDFAAVTGGPVATRTITFRCVTGWAVPDVRFTGVDLQQWLLAAGWNPQEDPWVTFYSGDGVYTDSLSAAQIARFRPLMAWRIDDRPLPVAQGFPVRLVVPGMYGYKSVKWLVRIDLGTRDQLGYWEVRGYPQNAVIGSYGNPL